MITKTYPAGHLEKTSDRTEADWRDPLYNPNLPDYQGHKWMRILWTEEKLSREDREQLKAEGYLLYVTDQPLCNEYGPGFGHSMFFTPMESAESTEQL
jgi:hypothetical protein